MKYINLTPHPITVVDGADTRTFPPSGSIARVELPLGPVTGVPDPQEGVQYIVSILVGEALPARRDLVIPGKQIRDTDGRIIGCRCLDLPEETSPALARLLRLARRYGFDPGEEV
jgi:hypothetical protein